MLKLEKNVPIPPKKAKVNSSFTSLLARMDVGDCIFKKGEPLKAKQNLSSGAFQWKKRINGSGADIQFTVRQVEGGARIWRIK
jgi:hypothetical protein